MKKLYLIRHAKSSWSDPAATDFMRKLNKRGMRDAPFMAGKLAGRGVSPDIIVSSPAKRAKKTAKFMAKGVGYKKKEIAYHDTIYTSSVADLYDVLKNIDDGCGEAFCVGHNYTITDLAEDLTGERIINIPTAGIVAMECHIEKWSQLSPGSCTLLFFDFPKNYPELQ